MMSHNSNSIFGLLLLCCLLLLSGCTATQERKKETFQDIQGAVREGVVEAPAETGKAIPEDISKALLPPISVQMPGIERDAPQQRFDVKVRHAPARDFFMSLVAGTPYNMVVHPKVSGRISLDMKNVTVPEVMETVRNVYGYDYKQTSAGFQVFPNKIHTRIYNLDYLSVKRAGFSDIRTNPGQATQTRDDWGGTSTTRRERTSTRGGEVTSGSSIHTQSEIDFWKELKASLELLIGAGQENDRKVTVNPQTGLIMVRAMPEEQRIVEEYLEKTEQVAQRQVIIEARILEVTLKDDFQAGINWVALQNDAGEIGMMSMENNEGGNFLTSVLSSASGLDASSSSGAAGAFTLGLNTSDFTMFIDLLKRQGDVQVLSNPRVSTVNNQKAVIKVGNDEFFVTDINTETIAAVTATTELDIELTPFFTGVSLDVTPQISVDGDIVMHIHPTVTLVTEQIKQVESERGTITMPLANSTVRESDSIIRAGNGQIVVLGGLMQNTAVDDNYSIPLLGDIPVLGALFSNKVTTTAKTELIILLKPIVVDDTGKQWSDVIRSSSARFQEMGSQLETGEEEANKPPADSVQ